MLLTRSVPVVHSLFSYFFCIMWFDPSFEEFWWKRKETDKMKMILYNQVHGKWPVFV